MNARLALLAPAGILVGHTLAYRLLFPHADEHAAALAGHGHLPLLAGLALLAALVAAALVCNWRGRLPAGRLLALQVVGFTALEVLEVAGGVAAGSALLPVLVVGAAAQAVSASGLLVALGGLAWCRARWASPHRTVTGSTPLPAPTAAVIDPIGRCRAVTPLSRRGPPHLLGR